MNQVACERCSDSRLFVLKSEKFYVLQSWVFFSWKYSIVVRGPISADPSLNFNLGFFISLFKSLFEIIFCIPFGASNDYILDKKN